jgi:hypothetical protein
VGAWTELLEVIDEKQGNKTGQLNCTIGKIYRYASS